MISNIYSKSSVHSSPALARQAHVILYDRLLPLLDSASKPHRYANGVDIHDIWNATTMDFITAYCMLNFLLNLAQLLRSPALDNCSRV
jgi:hypothetical protein